MLKSYAVALVLLGSVTLFPSSYAAEQWPTKPVRIVVPFGPSGGTDIQGRLLAKKFYDSVGQTFVVDNRPGAGGLIGGEIVAHAAPDGYTVLFTTASLSVNVTLYKKIPFDPFKDLEPVSWVSSVPLVLVVQPNLPVKTVPELIALTKQRQGKMNAGSNGAGTTSYLSVEMLKQLAGANVTNVPYKGGGPALTALIAGEVDFEFATALSAQPQIKSGKVRPLAVTTAKPSSVFPSLPTMESFYPGFVTDNWYAMFMPAGTPRAIVMKFNAEIAKAINSPEVRAFMAKEGADPVASSPEELAKFFKSEVEKYAKIIKAAHLSVD